jgi:hypothetical protein
MHSRQSGEHDFGHQNHLPTILPIYQNDKTVDQIYGLNNDNTINEQEPFEESKYEEINRARLEDAKGKCDQSNQEGIFNF